MRYEAARVKTGREKTVSEHSVTAAWMQFGLRRRTNVQSAQKAASQTHEFEEERLLLFVACALCEDCRCCCGCCVGCAVGGIKVCVNSQVVVSHNLAVPSLPVVTKWRQSGAILPCKQKVPGAWARNFVIGRSKLPVDMVAADISWSPLSSWLVVPFMSTSSSSSSLSACPPPPFPAVRPATTAAMAA